MIRLLIVENNKYLNECHKIMLKMANFDIAYVDSTDKAINFIEINKDLSSEFGFVVIYIADLLEIEPKILTSLKVLSRYIHIILIECINCDTKKYELLCDFVDTKGIHLCTIDNFVYELKRIVGRL